MSAQIPNVHDAFFKQVLSDPELAGTFLREHLPPEVMGLLGPEAPQPVPGSFVDEELQQHHSDLVFSVQLSAGGAAFAYVLLEHKSAPDHGARLQLLRYIVRLLTQWYEENDKQLPLPPVLPLLLHHGSEGWEPSCEFADLFGRVPEPLRPYLPSFRHALVDLARVDDATLSKRVRLRAFLKALKYGKRRDLQDRLYAILVDAPALDDTDVCRILKYFDKGPVTIDFNVVREILQQLVPRRTERIMGWMTQPFYEKGKAEGEATGAVRGTAKALALLLERRFGALPDAVRKRLFAADIASIETWLGRVLDAPDLQSVFSQH
jgi:predicted transposase YdaD